VRFTAVSASQQMADEFTGVAEIRRQLQVQAL
jgi:hypothetical protein